VNDLGAELRAGLAHLDAVREVRGLGLLIGAELDRPAAPVVADCLEHGLLVTSAGERVLRLTPPLVADRGDVAEALDILREVLA
jgi:acetylornithine/succinyldiaminopimelate/putrescine aminotransferase